MRIDTHPYSLQDCARQLKALETLRGVILSRKLRLEADRAAYGHLADFPTSENVTDWHVRSAVEEDRNYFANRGQD